MKNKIFTGSGVAIVTPFSNDEIDFISMQKLLDYHLSNKTDAIIVCGTTGESATLSEYERTKLISFVTEHINGNIPVIAGTGSNNTASSIRMTQEAKRIGVDGVLLVTPYYNKASGTGLVKHFSAIADSCDLPAILYNVPSRTGCNITLDVYEQLFKNANIVGVKEASGNISQISKIAAEFGDSISLYSGNDDHIVPVLSIGGSGVISVLANIAPLQTHNICELWFKGNVQESKDLQLHYVKLINTLFEEVNPIPVKYALGIMGLCKPEIRLPLTEPVEKTKDIIKNVLVEYNLVER